MCVKTRAQLAFIFCLGEGRVQWRRRRRGSSGGGKQRGRVSWHSPVVKTIRRTHGSKTIRKDVLYTPPRVWGTLPTIQSAISSIVSRVLPTKDPNKRCKRRKRNNALLHDVANKSRPAILLYEKMYILPQKAHSQAASSSFPTFFTFQKPPRFSWFPT